MWWLIALRGLRRGEAAGLRWCDVDLDHRVIMIDQQRIAERDAAGQAWHDTGYVLTTDDGTPLHPDWITCRFRRLVVTSGLPPCDPARPAVRVKAAHP
jgi:integrase